MASGPAIKPGDVWRSKHYHRDCQLEQGVISDVITVPSHTKKDNPEGPPHHIRHLSDANQRLNRHPE